MIELEKFLLKELNEIAKQLEIDLTNKKKKSEVIEAIEEHMEQTEGFILAEGKLDIMADG